VRASSSAASTCSPTIRPHRPRPQPACQRQRTRYWCRPNDSKDGFADRILFVFDPWRSAILLVAGDKAGKWNRWYTEMIPQAERLYEIYLKERAEEEETGR
jgi:hypothetical protein